MSRVLGLAWRPAVWMVLVLTALATAPVWAQEPSGADQAPPENGLGHRRLERQLSWMRELIIGLRETRPDLFDAHSPGRLWRAHVREGDVLDKVSTSLERELALLEQTVLALRQELAGLGPGVSNGRALFGPVQEPFSLDAPVHVVSWPIVVDGTGQVALPDSARVTNTWWELANVGDVPVATPRLLVNGFGGWRDLEEIVAAAVGEAREPRQQAERIWAFVVAHRFHSDPASGSIECHDPVKLLNVYGYGFCDDAANTFAGLARAAGMPARIWGLGGHVVPEVFYAEGWHMFDPDNEAWFRDGDGRVASVEQLVAEPQLLSHPVLAPGRERTYYGPGWPEPIFASRSDNRLAGYAIVEQHHTMDWVLRPGERVVLHHGDGRLRFTDGYLERATLVGNGDWILEQQLPSGQRTHELDFHLPWPLLSGSVTLSAVAPETRLQLVVGEQRWQLSPSPNGERTGVSPGARFSLSGLFAVGEPEPDYDVVLKLSGLPAVGSRLVVKLQFQHAPGALPRLVSGDNSVSCQGLSSGGALLLRLGYQLDDGRLASELTEVR